MISRDRRGSGGGGWGGEREAEEVEDYYEEEKRLGGIHSDGWEETEEEIAQMGHGVGPEVKLTLWLSSVRSQRRREDDTTLILLPTPVHQISGGNTVLSEHNIRFESRPKKKLMSLINQRFPTIGSALSGSLCFIEDFIGMFKHRLRLF